MMKKYLMTGVAAVALSVAFTSCSHETDVYNPDFESENLTNSYNEAFIRTFGQPAADQDWGFGPVVAGTRSTEKEDHTLAAMGLTKPTLKEGEAEFVMNWFRNNPNDNSVGLDITKYFIVFVGGNTTVNVWHHNWDNNYYTNNKNNGATSNFYDEYSTQTSILDQLKIDGEHINDWNANGGVTELVYDRKADNFIAHNSYCDVWTTKWKLAKITYNGEEGWYVGISSYAKKLEGTYTLLNEGQEGYDANAKEDRAYYTDYDRENYYDDYVFKIVPAEAEEKPDPVENIRIIAEDLHATAGSDFDFNDVVFDVHFTSSTTATVTIIAAGGTLPLTVDGHEVHGLFGQSTDTMINTNAENTDDPNNPGQKLKGYNSNGYHPSFDVTGIDSRNRGNDIEVRVNGTLLTATKGMPAAKVGVQPGFNYCMELVAIDSNYPRFANWVKQSNVIWY